MTQAEVLTPGPHGGAGAAVGQRLLPGLLQLDNL